MENYPDRISAQTLAAAMALGSEDSSGKVYQFAGSVPFLGLPVLSIDKIGNVYDVTDSFTSTSDFTDGGGKSYTAGTNVAIANTGTKENPVLKYDCLTGDLSEILETIAGENISGSASGTALSITDAADSRILGISIRGRSSAAGGSIVSVGDNGLTVTTENSDSSQTTSAAFSQSLPVRGIDSDTYDEIIYHGDRQQIVRRCGLVTLAQCTYWRLYEYPGGVKLFGAYITGECKRAPTGVLGFPCVCDSYTSSLIDPRKMPDKCISVGGNFKGSSMPNPSIVVRDDGYNGDVESFLADKANVTVLFPYSDTAVTSASVSSAEAAALRGLRTFAGTTSVSATDAPIIALEYIRNTDNGKAVAAIFDTQQSQIDNHEQRIADLETAVAEIGGA